jgi:hypothetical protein
MVTYNKVCSACNAENMSRIQQTRKQEEICCNKIKMYCCFCLCFIFCIYIIVFIIQYIIYDVIYAFNYNKLQESSFNDSGSNSKLDDIIL